MVGVPAPADFAGSGAHLSAYRDKFGAEPGTWSPYTYDSLNFLAYGVEKAGGTDAQKLTRCSTPSRAARAGPDRSRSIRDNGNRQPATVVIVKTDANGALHVDSDWAKAVGAPYSG